MNSTQAAPQPLQVTGIRKSGIASSSLVLTAGKQWKAQAKPNKNPKLRTAFSKRIVKDKQAQATQVLERQLKDERKAATEVKFPGTSAVIDV
jgi:Cgr1 family